MSGAAGASAPSLSLISALLSAPSPTTQREQESFSLSLFRHKRTRRDAGVDARARVPRLPARVVPRGRSGAGAAGSPRARGRRRAAGRAPLACASRRRPAVEPPTSQWAPGRVAGGRRGARRRAPLDSEGAGRAAAAPRQQGRPPSFDAPQRRRGRDRGAGRPAHTASVPRGWPSHTRSRPRLAGARPPTACRLPSLAWHGRRAAAVGSKALAVSFGKSDSASALPSPLGLCALSLSVGTRSPPRGKVKGEGGRATGRDPFFAARQSEGGGGTGDGSASSSSPTSLSSPEAWRPRRPRARYRGVGSGARPPPAAAAAPSAGKRPRRRRPRRPRPSPTPPRARRRHPGTGAPWRAAHPPRQDIKTTERTRPRHLRMAKATVSGSSLAYRRPKKASAARRRPRQMRITVEGWSCGAQSGPGATGCGMVIPRASPRGQQAPAQCARVSDQDPIGARGNHPPTAAGGGKSQRAHQQSVLPVANAAHGAGLCSLRTLQGRPPRTRWLSRLAGRHQFQPAALLPGVWRGPPRGRRLFWVSVKPRGPQGARRPASA